VAQLRCQRLNTTHQGVPSSGTDQQLNQRLGAFGFGQRRQRDLLEAKQHTKMFGVFEAWLRDNGATFPQLCLGKYDEDDGDAVHGATALVDIQRMDCVSTIPLRLLITVEMGQATDVGRAIVATGVELDAPAHVFLMVFLLTDRLRADSFFQPYYSVLPSSLRCAPSCWTPEELAWLRGSSIVERINDRNAAIEHDYDAVCGTEPACEAPVNLRRP
jgi:histone-lysine N-methyltransferase SETD3